jgi:hypothetical protein
MNIEKWIAENGFSAHDEAPWVVKADDLRALFAGKVLVPVEPTDAMIDALYPGSGEHTCRDLYKAAGGVFSAEAVAHMDKEDGTLQWLPHNQTVKPGDYLYLRIPFSPAQERTE